MTVTILIILDPDYPCYHMSYLVIIADLSHFTECMDRKKVCGESRTIRELDLKPANLAVVPSSLCLASN